MFQKLKTVILKRSLYNIIKHTPGINCISLWLQFPRLTNVEICDLLNALYLEGKIELIDSRLFRKKR